MKMLFLTASLFASAPLADAAMLDIAQTETANNSIFALTLIADEQFNGFSLSFTPSPGVSFINPGPGGLMDGPTTEKTFFNIYLEAPPVFGGYGLTAAGKVATESRLTSDFGLLGGYIDASQGIYLGNVTMPSGSIPLYHIVLQDTGFVVADLTGIISLDCPEPGSLPLVGLGLLGLAFRRRVL